MVARKVTRYISAENGALRQEEERPARREALPQLARPGRALYEPLAAIRWATRS